MEMREATMQELQMFAPSRGRELKFIASRQGRVERMFAPSRGRELKSSAGIGFPDF